MRVLIVKMSSLGDIVQAFSVAAYLKQHIEHLQIDWVVDQKCYELVAANPLIDHVVAFDSKRKLQDMRRFIQVLRKNEYDVVFDLQGNCKSALATLFAKARDKVGFTRKLVSEWPNALVTNQKIQIDTNVNIYQQYLQLVTRYFGDYTYPSTNKILLSLNQSEREILDSLVVPENSFFISFSSMWRSKELDLALLISLLEEINKMTSCYFIIPSVGEQEKKQAKKIAEHFPRCILIGHKPLSVVQHIMCQVQGVIAIDSLLLHLAAIAKVPTFSFFGPSSSYIYGPNGELHKSYQGKCPFQQVFTKRCQHLRKCQDSPCLKAATKDSIWPYIKLWVEQIRLHNGSE